MPDTSVWEDIRRAYEDHSVRTKDICRIYELTPAQLHRQARLEIWNHRPNAVEIAMAKSAAKASAARASGQVDAVILSESSPSLETTYTGSSKLPSPSLHKARKIKRQPIASRRALVQRLYAVIDAKLSLLEQRFANEMTILANGKGKATSSSADHERDTRAIGTLIKNLEHVTEYDDGHFGTAAPGAAGANKLKGAAAQSASLAATRLADEADRKRRELAERLQRFIDAASGSA